MPGSPPIIQQRAEPGGGGYGSCSGDIPRTLAQAEVLILPGQEEAVEQWHPQNDGVPDLHVVSEVDLAAAADALEWAGPAVPPGHTVRTGYVHIHDVICFAPFGHQLLPAEVERAYRRQLEMGDQQAWPPPTGYWRSDHRFVLTDGRNRFVACLMLGVEYLLVAWLVPAS